MIEVAGPLQPDLVRTEETARSFRWLSWGLLMCFVDLKVCEIPLLPDPVGWVIILLALHAIRDVHTTLPNLVILAWIGLGLSVVLLFEPVIAREAGSEAVSTTLPLLDDVIELVLVWQLFGVVIDIAQHLADPTLAGQADFRRKLVVFIDVSRWCLGFLLSRAQLVGAGFLILMLLPVVVVNVILVFTLLRNAARACQPE
ncbi:MAG: hypothetical protein V3U11_02925 [Planctomycetota bacterium]